MACNLITKNGGALSSGNFMALIKSTLADGIIVGAGSVVTKSFLEPGIILAGVPAKKIGVREGWEAPKSEESRA